MIAQKDYPPRIVQELIRIEAAMMECLCQPITEKTDEDALRAAQHALMWAVDERRCKSPFLLIRGSRGAKKDDLEQGSP